jgi:hypothetical protein
MITNFTTDELIAELKKRGCKMTVVKPKTYELQDDCWDIVKEYAGIYNWTTKWNKLHTISVGRLHSLYKTSLNRRFTNIHCYDTRTRILKNIFQKYKSREIMLELREMIDPPIKIKKKKDMSWLNECKVGDEVYAKISKMNGEMLGVITKINKSSASFRWYATRQDRRYDKVYPTRAECIM